MFNNFPYSEVPIKSVIFLIIFGDLNPTYMALSGATRLFMIGKSSYLHCFLRNTKEKTHCLLSLCVIHIKKKSTYLHSLIKTDLNGY